jgi:hypothetical protein
MVLRRGLPTYHTLKAQGQQIPPELTQKLKDSRLAFLRCTTAFEILTGAYTGSSLRSPFAIEKVNLPMEFREDWRKRHPTRHRQRMPKRAAANGMLNGGCDDDDILAGLFDDGGDGGGGGGGQPGMSSDAGAMGNPTEYGICSAPGCKCHWGKGDWREVVHSFGDEFRSGSGEHQPAMGRECRCCCCRAPAEEIDLLDSDDESNPEKRRGSNGAAQGQDAGALLSSPCITVRPFHPCTFNIARTLVLMKGRRGSFFNRLFDYLPQEQGMGVIFNILDYADGFGLPSAGVMLSHFENVHFGLPDPGSNSGHIWAKQVVSRFMNRLLGLPLPQQQAIFTYFQWLFVQAEAQQRDDGTLDVGVTALAGESELVQDEPIEVLVLLLYCTNRSRY